MSKFGGNVLSALRCPKERSPNICTAVLWIWSIVPPSLLLFGTVCNTLSIVVLLRLRKQPFTLLLRALAVSDTIFLWSSVIKNIAFHIQGIRLRNMFQVYCTIEQWLIVSSGYVSLTLLMLLTIQRVLATLLPIWSKANITNKSTVITSIIACVVIMLPNGHFILGNTLKSIQKTSFNVSVDLIDNRSSIINNTYIVLECVPRSEMFYTYRETKISRLLAIYYSIFAIFIIVVGNLTTSITLLLRRCLFNHHGISRFVSRATKSLLVVSLYFCFAICPLQTLVVYRHFFLNINDENAPTLHLFNALAMCSLYSNYSCNFLLYLLTGEMFKKEMVAMVSEVKNRRCIMGARKHGNVSTESRTHQEESRALDTVEGSDF